MDTSKITGISYLPRAVDPLMIRVLDSAGAAILEGPRGCGKTMTGLAHASSYTLLDTPEAQTAAEIDPRLLLAGASPRLLDEWQLIPQIWNLARREVDFSSELDASSSRVRPFLPPTQSGTLAQRASSESVSAP